MKPICKGEVYRGHIIVTIQGERPRFVVVEAAWRGTVELHEFEHLAAAKRHIDGDAAPTGQRCCCLEKVGDNGHCPVHGGILVTP